MCWGPSPAWASTVRCGARRGVKSPPPTQLGETAQSLHLPTDPGAQALARKGAGREGGLLEESNDSGSHSEELRIVLGLRVTCWEEQNQLSRTWEKTAHFPPDRVKSSGQKGLEQELGVLARQAGRANWWEAG